MIPRPTQTLSIIFEHHLLNSASSDLSDARADADPDLPAALEMRTFRRITGSDKWPTEEAAMTPWKRFWIGGGGALLPLLVTLLAVDISQIVDSRTSITLGVYIGAILRYLVLFILGGIVAWLNSDEDKPFKLVQLGIGAPAILSSLINAAPPVKQTAFLERHIDFALIATAHARETDGASQVPQGIQLAGLVGDVFKGATRSLPNAVVQSNAPPAVKAPAIKVSAPVRPALPMVQFTSPTLFHVRRARCYPRCRPNAGDDYIFEDKFPKNLALVDTTAHVICHGRGCASNPTSVKIDNVRHVATLKIKSRSAPVDIQLGATAHLLTGG